jgi:photosystem II stability/assembly factor-like uncharacterized protein
MAVTRIRTTSIALVIPLALAVTGGIASSRAALGASAAARPGASPADTAAGRAASDAPGGPLAPAETPPQDLSWFPAGLDGGPVYGVAVSPTSAAGRILFAGGHEVFRSVNGGASWSLPRDLTGDVANVVAGPGGVVFVASADGQGQRTTNGGGQWYATRIRGDAPVWFLAVSPDFQRDQVAYGITSEDWRLYRMEKGGTTWTEVIIETDAQPRYQFGALAFSPNFASDGTLFVGSDRGIFKTDDGGRSWQLQSSPASGAPVFGAEGGTVREQGIVVPQEYGDDPNRRYDADIRDLFAYNVSGLYYSQDDGVTWRPLPVDAERIHGVAVSNGWPNDPIIVAAVQSASGAVGAVSTDGGATFRPVLGADGIVGTSVAVDHVFSYIPPEAPPDQTIIFTPYLARNWVHGSPFPPPRPTPPPYIGTRRVFLGTDGDGLWCSLDAGQTWGACDNGLANARATTLAFLPVGGDGTVLAGTDASGLYRSADGGRTWRWLDAHLPRGAAATIYAVCSSPTFDQDHTIFLAAASGVWKSTDKGLSWQRTSGPAPAKTLAVSPGYATDGTLLAAEQKSTDGGQTWVPLNVTTPWTAVAFSPKYTTDQTIYSGEMLPASGRGDAVRVSTDGGEAWVVVDSSYLRNRSVLSLHAYGVNSFDNVRIFVGTDRGMVYSHDGGKTWRTSSDLSRSTYGFASQPTQDPHYGQTAVVLAVGEQGAVWSPDRGVNWFDKPELTVTGLAAAISPDGAAMLVAAPTTVRRYGLGSVRVFTPELRVP